MFSRSEREYLLMVAQGVAARPDPPGRVMSPGYRRKLQWAIRRKASRALSDWELYLAAVERDPRMLAPHTPQGQPPIPLYSDPFVTALRAVSSTLGRLSRKKGPRHDPKAR
jgi:hypothetical protein